MNNDEVFKDFWANYQWPDAAPIFYRLYYDEETGNPLCYSMEDLPGKYIDITQEQYTASNSKVKVRNGVIVPNSKPLPPKLIPSTVGTPCHPTAVDIVVDPSDPNQTWILRHGIESN